MNKIVGLVLLFASCSIALGQNLPPSVIEMGGRYFDLRADVSKLPRSERSIPLTEVKWLVNLTSSEPDLKFTVVHIRAMLDPRERHNWPAVDPKDGGSPNYYRTTGIPKKFIIEGFQTRSTHPSNRQLVLIPNDVPDAFYVRCTGAPIEVRAYCGVVAKYPPNERHFLLARVYGVTTPMKDFRAIAGRILEIAMCLDVTDAFLEGNYVPEPYVDPDGPLPELRDCHDKIS